VRAMVEHQRHRGPDAQDVKVFADGRVALGVDRLRILDLDPHADGVLSTPDGRWHLAYNGEVYNHVELRAELRSHHDFRTTGDAEVVLAAWAAWGSDALDRFLGMFAFLLWDDERQELHAVRDRFGVKPLARHIDRHRMAYASEVGGLLAAGVPAEPSPAAWAGYLATGQTERHFIQNVTGPGAGSHLVSRLDGTHRAWRWYDPRTAVGSHVDERPDEQVADEVAELLAEATGLRFRSDVPVGIALSSGLDSSSLLGLVDQTSHAAAAVPVFTFTTGDQAYDEDADVARLLTGTGHQLHRCRLDPDEVPALASSVHRHLRQPFGGIPTLAYARLFERARTEGVTVVLDGQGLDESWAGYDYYALADDVVDAPLVQGTSSPLTRPDCLDPRLRAYREAPPADGLLTFPDPLRQVQLRDLTRTKLPRALRYNDAVSMRSSVELREPFLDHRLVELALRQPPHRTLGDGEGKALIRRLAPRWWPEGAPPAAPKRPVQTPQREWLRGPLRPWAEGRIEAALDRFGGTWLVTDRVQAAWSAFAEGEGDNAFAPWQWISLGLEAEAGG
jgi:asparagine synthase (glutamine-hydrolysing)